MQSNVTPDHAKQANFSARREVDSDPTRTPPSFRDAGVARYSGTAARLIPRQVPVLARSAKSGHRLIVTRATVAFRKRLAGGWQGTCGFWRFPASAVIGDPVTSFWCCTRFGVLFRSCRQRSMPSLEFPAHSRSPQRTRRLPLVGPPRIAPRARKRGRLVFPRGESTTQSTNVKSQRPHRGLADPGRLHATRAPGRSIRQPCRDKALEPAVARHRLAPVDTAVLGSAH